MAMAITVRKGFMEFMDWKRYPLVIKHGWLENPLGSFKSKITDVNSYYQRVVQKSCIFFQ